MDCKEIYNSLPSLWNDTAVTGWSFYPEFRRKWESLLKKTLDSQTEYFPISAETVTCLPITFCGIGVEFHFDRSKMEDWYRQELKRGKRVVFFPERLRREREGLLDYKGVSCTYDPKLPEPELSEENRNIFACAVPALPVEMRVVYGSSMVERKINPLRKKTVSLFRIPTDYVPAFLASPFEICLYLFFMDYCILKSDAGKVKDEEMKPLLHIFRPSPMLAVKGLI